MKKANEKYLNFLKNKFKLTDGDLYKNTKGKWNKCTKERTWVFFEGTKNNEYTARIAWFIKHGEFPNKVTHIDKDKENNNIDNIEEVSYECCPGGPYVYIEGSYFPSDIACFCEKCGM